MPQTLDMERLPAPEFCVQEVRSWTEALPQQPLAYLHSFGCQLNVADGEKLCGILRQMGYGFTEDIEKASLILYNTCAVRENAEDRVFGTLGSIKKLKRENPALIICVTGCMTAQQQVADKIRESYRHVDIVLGTSAVSRLAQMLYAHMHGVRYAQDIEIYTDIPEGLEAMRESSFKASVPIMYGCNNFCTYCIVPYVRGRERSRKPEHIIEEVRSLVAQGYKEIMLLGQNVNSYGKDLDDGMDFPTLLRELDKLEAAPDNAKLAEAAQKAAAAAKAAEEGNGPETFKDYVEKWVYSVKDHAELLDKIGGNRLMSLKNAPHLGYSVTHLK